VLTLEWCRGLNFNHYPSHWGFKFILMLNSFVTMVHWGTSEYEELNICTVHQGWHCGSNEFDYFHVLCNKTLLWLFKIFLLIKMYVSYKTQCFMLFKIILCFYYQDILRFWKQIGVWHGKWILMFMIPMFVAVYLFQLIMNMDTLLCFPDFSHPSSFPARIVECIIFPHTACHSGDTLVQPAFCNSVFCLFISACVL